jgi:hypothetical protein
MGKASAVTAACSATRVAPNIAIPVHAAQRSRRPVTAYRTCERNAASTSSSDIRKLIAEVRNNVLCTSIGLSAKSMTSTSTPRLGPTSSRNKRPSRYVTAAATMTRSQIVAS